MTTPVKAPLLLLFATILAAPVWASNHAEVKLTFGQNYQSYKAGAAANLDPQGRWNVYASCNQTQQNDPDVPGWNRLAFLELNRTGEALCMSGNFSYSADNNQITAYGPGASVFYTHFRDTAPGATSPLTDVFTLGLDCPILFYQATVETATPENIRLTQVAPMAFLDVALIPGWLNANVSGCVFFYSEDPSRIAGLADASLAAPAAASLESLMAGFLWTNWNAGLYLSLPGTWQVSGSFGRQKQVYPDEWVNNLDMSLSGKLFPFLKTNIGWRHFASSAGDSDLFSVSARFIY